MIRIVFRLFRQGIADLRLNPLAQIFTLTAVTLVVFLSGIFLMALATLNHQLGTIRGETVFQVYWKTDFEKSEVEEQWQGFKNMPGYTRVKTFTPDEALVELNKNLDKSRGGDLSAFPILKENNPLSPTALVYFAPEGVVDIEKWIRETDKYLEEMPGVSRVVATPLRDELGQAWRKVSHYVMWPSIIFLTLILGLVVGNTIRLSLLAREHEIEILQIVGANNWYIRLPLIVSGALQGFFGGAIALGLLSLVHKQLKNSLNFPPLLMEIQFLTPAMTGALVAVPVLMGILASWLAVRD